MKPPITIDVSLPGEPPRRMFAVTMPEVVNATTPHPRPRASRASRQSRTVKNSQSGTGAAADDANGPPASDESQDDPDPDLLCTPSLCDVIESCIPGEMPTSVEQSATTRVVTLVEAASGDEPGQKPCLPKCRIAAAQPDQGLRETLSLDERESTS